MAKRSSVLIVQSGIEQAGVLGADGEWKAVLDGMKIDEVAEDVPLDRLEEGLAAALQSLEEVRAAEPHQPLARSRRSAITFASAVVGGSCGFSWT